jgi:hypothetical protein
MSDSQSRINQAKNFFKNLDNPNQTTNQPPKKTTTNTAGGPPPPPSGNVPPPPPPSSLLMNKDDHPKTGGSDDRGALLSAITGGSGGGGLRKVQDHEKKRPGDGRVNDPLVPQSKKTPTTKTYEEPKTNVQHTGTPSIRYDRDRTTHWVEYQNNRQDVVINIEEPKQKVYVRGCVDTVITVVGKCTTVNLENSKGTSVIFDDVIATVEVVNSSKVQLQANASVPSFILDKTDSCHIYILNEKGYDTNIISSCCTAVLVSTNGATEDADMIETPLPEQFITNHTGKRWNTTPTEHSGV